MGAGKVHADLNRASLGLPTSRTSAESADQGARNHDLSHQRRGAQQRRETCPGARQASNRNRRTRDHPTRRRAGVYTIARTKRSRQATLSGRGCRGSAYAPQCRRARSMSKYMRLPVLRECGTLRATSGPATAIEKGTSGPSASAPVQDQAVSRSAAMRVMLRQGKGPVTVEALVGLLGPRRAGRRKRLGESKRKSSTTRLLGWTTSERDQPARLAVPRDARLSSISAALPTSASSSALTRSSALGDSYADAGKRPAQTTARTQGTLSGNTRGPARTLVVPLARAALMCGRARAFPFRFDRLLGGITRGWRAAGRARAPRPRSRGRTRADAR